jgi:hypothetical protein
MMVMMTGNELDGVFIIFRGLTKKNSGLLMCREKWGWIESVLRAFC